MSNAAAAITADSISYSQVAGGASTGLSAAQMGLIGAGVSAVAGIAGAAVAGSAQVKQAQIYAEAQKAQAAAAYQSQLLDQEFSKTLLSYIPQLALLGAGTIFAVVAIKTFSE